MNKSSIKSYLLLIILLNFLTGCGRDLSSSTYTSYSTLNIALKGRLISKRNINLSETDKLGNNSTGASAGALLGGLGAASYTKSPVVVAGGAILGGVSGAAIESALGKTKGIEYLVEINKSQISGEYYECSRLLKNYLEAIKLSGLVTIIQGVEVKNDPILSEGQQVIVILSEKRTRLIPAN